MTTIPQSGVYGIIHIATSRIYVGSTINIQQRWKHHRHCLNHNTHVNGYLQQAWNKYGVDAFEWVVIEKVTDTTQLIYAEQKWIDYNQSTQHHKGFNIKPIAGSNLGVKLTEEAKERIGRASRTRPRGLTDQNVRQILERCAAGDYHKDIARDFHVAELTVGRIARRRTYIHIKIPLEMEQRLISYLNKYAKGSKTGSCKLTENDIPVIRQRLANGESCSLIARDYSVSHMAINLIKNGKSWIHIPL
jgi:group I intron endonuclease